MKLLESPRNKKRLYVKMNILRTKTAKKEHPFCIKHYFKWILWFTLSFYFFSIFPNTTITNKPKSLNDLKVYIYELPTKYNTDWLKNARCSSHLFASEVAIHKALSNSNVRTFDPSLANFFFVPVYVSCNFSTINGFPILTHAREVLSSAVDLISKEHPFWNRTNGSDHVFVASHDYGACFHAMVHNDLVFVVLFFVAMVSDLLAD